MNYELKEFLKEVIKYLRLFEDKETGLQCLEILTEDDADSKDILEAVRKANKEKESE